MVFKVNADVPLDARKSKDIISCQDEEIPRSKEGRFISV